MMEHGKPIIYVKNVRKVYRMGDEEVVALKRINLRIYKGEAKRRTALYQNGSLFNLHKFIQFT